MLYLNLKLTSLPINPGLTRKTLRRWDVYDLDKLAISNRSSLNERQNHTPNPKYINADISISNYFTT